MATLGETLTELDMRWIPQPVLDSLREDFSAANTTASTLDSLVAIRQKIETGKNTDKRIRSLKLRVVSAVARSLNRKNEIDWAQCLPTPDHPKELLEIFFTLGFSCRSVSIPLELRSEYGKRLQTIILRKFGTHESFHGCLVGTLENTREENKQEKERRKEHEMEAVLSSIRECKNPDDLHFIFKKIGLPNDWYKNTTWRETLWRSSRKKLFPLMQKIRLTAEIDPAFKVLDWSSLRFYSILHNQKAGKNLQFFSRGKFLKNKPVRLKTIGIPEEIVKFVVDTFCKYPSDSQSDDTLDDLFPFGKPEERVNPWAALCACTNPEGKKGKAKEFASNSWTSGATRFLAKDLEIQDGLTSSERIDWCETPKDFRRLFFLLGIPSGKWNDRAWMEYPPSDTEMLNRRKDRRDLVSAVELRFGSYDAFIAWMKAKPDFKTWAFQKVRACRTKTAFLGLCKELGIPNDHWKSESWMLYRSLLPPEQGGIGEDLSTVVDAVEEHPYLDAFGLGKVRTYREFVQAIDNSMTSTEQAWDIVYSCCERFGMSMDELLREANRKLFNPNPKLVEAMNFLS